MKRKFTKIITAILGVAFLFSCGHPTLKSKEEAIKFLETHKFYDDGAHVYGQSGGKGLKTGFGLTFSNGNVVINGETLPYTIEEIRRSQKFSGLGFHIKFCGSQRFAYGGCIDCYLSGGMDENGAKIKMGPSMQVEGAYVKAFFSFIGEGISNK